MIPFLALSVLLAGCSAAAPLTPPASEGGGASAGPPAAQSGGENAQARGFPNISSCDQVAAVVGDYIDGLPLDKENSYIQPDAIGCVWSTPADAVGALTDIQSFSVDITEDSGDVPDPEAAAEFGMDMYFTDPRLDAVGGVGLWMDADSAVVGGGTGSVIVPGVDVALTDSRWGQEGRLTKDSLVDVALTLLEL